MEETIKRFIIKNILIDERELLIDEPLLDGGILDSMQILRLVSFLEKHFEISLSIRDLTTENFNSVMQITQLVKNKKNGN